MGNDRYDLKSEMILKLALAEQLEQDPEVAAFLPEKEQEVIHEFSPEHEKKIKKISRMASRAEHRRERKKRLLQTAACIVVFLGISAVTVSSVDAFRIPVLSFFADVREKATQYRIMTKELSPLTKDFSKYEPTYVPDGFYVENVEDAKNRASILYTNDTNDLWYEIHYSQKPFTLSFDSEDAIKQDTMINGNKTIVVFENEEFRASMYTTTVQIVLAGTIPWDEGEKILKSIK